MHHRSGGVASQTVRAVISCHYKTPTQVEEDRGLEKFESTMVEPSFGEEVCVEARCNEHQHHHHGYKQVCFRYPDLVGRKVLVGERVSISEGQGEIDRRDVDAVLRVAACEGDLPPPCSQTFYEASTFTAEIRSQTTGSFNLKLTKN